MEHKNVRNMSTLFAYIYIYDKLYDKDKFWCRNI